MILLPDAHATVDFPPLSGLHAGSLEALSSVQSILLQCREAMDRGEETALRALCPQGDALRLSHVLEAQRQNDPLACRVLDRAMFYVGVALANIVDIINPHLVLLSGEIFTNPQNAQTVERALFDHAFLPDDESLRVLPTDMGEFSGAIGAAACCIEKYFLRG